VAVGVAVVGRIDVCVLGRILSGDGRCQSQCGQRGEEGSESPDCTGWRKARPARARSRKPDVDARALEARSAGEIRRPGEVRGHAGIDERRAGSG
jgi:hypothetical protein